MLIKLPVARLVSLDYHGVYRSQQQLRNNVTSRHRPTDGESTQRNQHLLISPAIPYKRIPPNYWKLSRFTNCRACAHCKAEENHKPKRDELNEGFGVLHISSVVIWLNDDDGDKGNHSLAYVYSLVL